MVRSKASVLRAASAYAVVAAAVSTPTTAHAAGACHLGYYGGPVLSNIEVVEVYWTDTVPAAVTGYLPGFYSAVLNSSYLDWLHEYDTHGLAGGSNQFIGRGTYKGAYTITPSLQATTLDTTQIGAELVAQIHAGNLPGPTFDGGGNVNTFYAVDFPKGYTIQLQTGGGTQSSCVTFCALEVTMHLDGKSVPLGVFPDIEPSTPCAGGCGSASNYLDNVAVVHAHELLIGITDPLLEDAIDSGASSLAAPAAWYSTDQSSLSCSNVADTCNEQPKVVAGYPVESGWSNVQNACVVSGPAAPICSGPNTPAGCRGCTVSDDGVGCTGATPVCDVRPSSSTYGQCIASLPSGDGGMTDASSPDGALSDGAAPEGAVTDAASADAAERDGGSAIEAGLADRSAEDAPAADAGEADGRAGGTCVPGQQIACACVGGGSGAQACLPDGSGFMPCQCPDAGAAADAAAPSSGDSSSGCGCRVGRTSARSSAFSVFALLIGAAAAARRRPRERRAANGRFRRGAAT